MSRKYASGKYTLAECDRCGFVKKLKELKEIFIRTTNTNIKVCKECYEPDHPQNMQGMYPVDDPQAIRDPRPDFAGYAQSRAQIIAINSSGGPNPVGEQDIASVISAGRVGQVVVSTS